MPLALFLLRKVSIRSLSTIYLTESDVDVALESIESSPEDIIDKSLTLGSGVLFPDADIDEELERFDDSDDAEDLDLEAELLPLLLLEDPSMCIVLGILPLLLDLCLALYAANVWDRFTCFFDADCTPLLFDTFTASPELELLLSQEPEPKDVDLDGSDTDLFRCNCGKKAND